MAHPVHQAHQVPAGLTGPKGDKGDMGPMGWGEPGPPGPANVGATVTSHVFTTPASHTPGEFYTLTIQARVGNAFGPIIALSNIQSGAVSTTLSPPSNFRTDSIATQSATVRWNYSGSVDRFDVQGYPVPQSG